MMQFDDFVAAVEATLLAEYQVELVRARSGPKSVDWYAGSLLLRLEVESIQTAALQVDLKEAMVTPVCYPITLRAARDVAHDLAALTDLPETDR